MRYVDLIPGALVKPARIGPVLPTVDGHLMMWQRDGLTPRTVMDRFDFGIILTREIVDERTRTPNGPMYDWVMLLDSRTMRTGWLQTSWLQRA